MCLCGCEGSCGSSKQISEIKLRPECIIKKYPKFEIHIYEDRVEGYLKTSIKNGLSDILFYNDERGKRYGGGSHLVTNFEKTSDLIELYATVLYIVKEL